MFIPDRIAAVDGDRRFTYDEFNRACIAWHRPCAATAWLPGDRVAVLAPNTIAALEVHFGVMLAGGVLAMLNTRLQARELEWILNHCGAKILIADPQLLPVVSPVIDNLRDLTLVTDDYEGLLAQGEYPFDAPPVTDEDGMIAINYTSGTTGFPKGVMYTHRGGYHQRARAR